MECANAIRKKIVSKQAAQKVGDEAFGILMRRKNLMFSTLYSTNELIQPAYEISKILHQHPIPDCLYLALAERENARMVTADRKFYDRVKNSAYTDFITWIEDPPKML